MHFGSLTTQFLNFLNSQLLTSNVILIGTFYKKIVLDILSGEIPDFVHHPFYVCPYDLPSPLEFSTKMCTNF